MSVTALHTFVATSSLLWGWLWPFSDDGPEAPEHTVGTLYVGAAAEIGDEPVVADLGFVIEQYRLFVELDAGDPEQRIEAMRRLADLNLAVAEIGLAEGNDEAARAQLSEAIDVYEKLLAFAPHHGDLDQVLYQLARAADAAGDATRAESALERLAAGNPQSPLNAEAWFRRGEGMFAKGDYHTAVSAYESVLGREPEGPFADQARYKLGWAQFKLGFHDESSESFIALLDRLLPADGDAPADVIEGASRAEREIFEDVFRALAIGYSYDLGHEAISDLAGNDTSRRYIWMLYQRLGELYLEKERFIDAADAYRAFADVRPGHDRAPNLHVSATTALEAGGLADQALASRRQFVELYGLDGLFWIDRRRAESPHTVERIVENLTLLAEHDHALAQTGIDPEAATRAMASYRRFVDWFPEDARTPERHFMLGELLFDAGRYVEAVEAYEGVAYGYGNHPGAAESAWASIVASQRFAETLEGADAREWSLDDIERKLRFGRSFPAHAESHAALVSSAETLYETGDLPRAVSIADESLERQLAEPLAVVALRVTAHARFDLEDYSGAEDAYVQLAGRPSVTETEQAEIRERIAASVYRSGQVFAAAGDRSSAIRSFLRVESAAPGSEVVPVALHDAVAMMLADEAWSDAVPVLRELRARFPFHEHTRDAGVRLAFALESQGDHRAAAVEYEALSTETDRDPEMRRSALVSAVDLFESAGATHEARSAAERYVGDWPHPFDAALEMRLRLADWARDRDDFEQRRRWLDEIVSAHANAGEARSDRSMYLAAHASYELAEPLVASFEAARLVAPLEDSLRIKQARMEFALEALGRAAAYGVADVSTGATLDTAEIYADLANALLESERPANLSELELEEYQFLLEEQAFPFEEKAIEIHEINARRAAEGIFDESVQASFARLGELVPGRYDRQERHERIIAKLD